MNDNIERSTTTIDISKLNLCIEEVKNRWLLRLDGPQPPKDYNNLLTRLENSKHVLPNIYVDTVYNPFFEFLQKLGKEQFETILSQDENLEREAGLILDIAQAILQRGEKYLEKSTNSFQSLVSDLYDGFLSNEDRHNVKKPDKEIVAPLVKWGNPQFGPYTWPADVTGNIGIKAAIVSLPPSHAEGCLFGWSSIGHETGGHDILHADNGLLLEIKNTVKNALKSNGLDILAKYWSDRIDETASDVLGILNMGPAAGIGLIGYFCGINAALSGKAVLRNSGSANDVHPVDILRGYLAAESVRLLKFSKANEYADVIKNETDKYLNIIKIDSQHTIDKQTACKSCKIVADIIINHKLKTLENHSLGEIQNWHNEDEEIVNKLRSYLSGKCELPQTIDSNIYATHVAAAAVYESMSKNSNITLNFEKMLDLLQVIYSTRKLWTSTPLENENQRNTIDINNIGNDIKRISIL